MGTCGDNGKGYDQPKSRSKIEDDNDEKGGDEKQVEVKHHDIYIRAYDPKETMYTYQTG